MVRLALETIRDTIFAREQRHHIIPEQFKDHPAIKAAGVRVNAKDNLISLPDDEDGSGRSRHKGFTHAHRQYNREWEKFLDQVEDRIRDGLITIEEARAEIEAERETARSDLETGRVDLGKTKNESDEPQD